MLEIVKMLLGMDISDTSKDNLLNHFIKKATDIILGYCNIDARPNSIMMWLPTLQFSSITTGI